jgi:hypothetical protein
VPGERDNLLLIVYPQCSVDTEACWQADFAPGTFALHWERFEREQHWYMYSDYPHISSEGLRAISLSPRTVDVSGEILLYCHEVTSSLQYLLFET